MLKVVVVLFVVLSQLAATVWAGCLCANTAVIVRSGASTRYRRLGTVYPGHCLVLKSTPGRRNQGYYWRNVDYRGQNAWVPEGGSWWRVDASCTTGTDGTDSGRGTNTGSSASCLNIVSRASWGARSPTSSPTRMSSTPRYVFIHHSATAGCDSLQECKTRVRAFQNYHIDNNGWSDIGYSFVVGEDGNVYEGRGWGKVGAHTRGYNSQGIGICIAGDFTRSAPSSAALNAVNNLIACGVRNGHIRSDYTLKGHRDVGSTSCPGNRLYDVIKTWPHYG